MTDNYVEKMTYNGMTGKAKKDLKELAISMEISEEEYSSNPSILNERLFKDKSYRDMQDMFKNQNL